MSKTRDEIELYIKLYNEGKGLREIGRQCNCTAGTVKRHLISENIQLLKGYDCIRKVINNPFENINDSDVQYYLGWIASDGCIFENTIGLELAEDSIDVLHQYVKFLGGKSKIEGPFHVNIKGQNSYCVRFQHKDIVKYLSNLGITNTKSKTLNINFDITWDFIRGVFEGDGTLYESKPTGQYVYLDINILSASEVFIKQLEDFFIKNNIQCRINDDKEYKRIWINKTDSLLFFNKLYYNDSIPILKRKFNKFKLFFEKSKNNYRYLKSDNVNLINKIN